METIKTLKDNIMPLMALGSIGLLAVFIVLVILGLSQNWYDEKELSIISVLSTGLFTMVGSTVMGYYFGNSQRSDSQDKDDAFTRGIEQGTRSISSRGITTRDLEEQ